MNLQIRPARVDDMRSIIFLWKELMEFHKPMSSNFEMSPDAELKFTLFLKSCIKSPEKTFVIVAEDQPSQIIQGYILGVIGKYPPVFKIQQFGDITDICVARDMRRHAIGKKLVEEAKNWYKKRGIRLIHIQAATKNPISQAFWKKMGFIPYLETMYFNN